MRRVAAKRIVIVQGHPDAGSRRFCHALAERYADGAREAGHQVEVLDVARMDFPLLRTQADWESGEAPAAIAAAQAALRRAQHVVVVFPLWLGDMPALLKGFLEQALRPGFALGREKSRGLDSGLLKGRSARIVVTMGMPAFFYRLYYRSHSVKNLERNILRFCGFAPVRTTLIGTVAARSQKKHAAWLEDLAALGRRAA